MSIRKDCFAFSSDNVYNGCNILNKLYCKFEDCKFYKDKETFKLEKEKFESDIYEKP